jgi:hypothetical protein
MIDIPKVNLLLLAIIAAGIWTHAYITWNHAKDTRSVASNTRALAVGGESRGCLNSKICDKY